MRTFPRFYISSVVLFLVILTLLIVDTSAGGTAWQAWLYDETTGDMFNVASDSVVYAEVTLPSLAGEEFPRTVAVSPDGSYAAYVMTNTVTQAKRLIIFDLWNTVELYSYVIPNSDQIETVTSLNSRAHQYMFNEDQRFAFSYHQDGFWEMQIIDFVSANPQIIASIDSNHPMNQIIEANTSTVFPLPSIENFSGLKVHFKIIPLYTDGFYRESYVWDLASNGAPDGIFLPDATYSGVGTATFNRTEVITSDHVPTLPNREEEYIGIYSQVNALLVYDPLLSGYTPFYNNADYSHSLLRFIQNGTRIFTLASHIVWDENDRPVYEWHIVNRDGSLAGVMPEITTWDSAIYGVGEGFLYTADIPDVTPFLTHQVQQIDSSVLMFVDTLNNPVGADVGSVIYVAAPNTHPKIVWAKDNLADTRTPPGEWANAFDAPQPITPTSPPPPTLDTGNTAELVIGGAATINTTEGDRANVRQSPSLNAQILTALPKGELVTIMSGPFTGSGLQWWQIQTNIGLLGYVVEEVDDVQVLIPG